jgi:hypothetical protein
MGHAPCHAPFVVRIVLILPRIGYGPVRLPDGRFAKKGKFSPPWRETGRPAVQVTLPSLYNPLLRCLVSPLDPLLSPPHPGGPTKESDSMRRTVLSAMALACTAVLASTVPAFANAPSPVPTTRAGATAAPREATPVPSAPATQAPTKQRTAPRAVPGRPAGRGQVAVVPKGAPDTGGVAASSGPSGTETGLAGAGAAAMLLGGGAAVFAVRRRRTTGA